MGRRRSPAAVEGSTPERLRAAAGDGVLADGEAATLAEAFELALELRIGHHSSSSRPASAPDDLLDPAAISPLTRGSPARRVPRGQRRAAEAARMRLVR